MYSYKDCQEIIDTKISELKLTTHPVELYEPIKYILSIGGKRLRPCLTLLACNIFSEDISSAINPAIGLEVFHNFTLLHDDIMDNASMRRNHKTVHEKWNNNTAILSGDAMMILAYDLISKTPDNIFPAVFKVFNKTALEVCEGQQLDMNYEIMDTVSESEYLEMIRLKTAVLISTSLAIGGIIAKTSNQNIEQLYNLGINIGLAFQIQDDLLDAFGEVNKFGKSIGGDILSNKKTYLLISALNSEDKESVKELKDWISRKKFDPQEKIKSVIDIYKRIDIEGKTQNLIDLYFSKAIENLDFLTVEKSRKDILYNVLIKMKKREN